MSKHTPGPWRVVKLTKAWGIYDRDGTPLAKVGIAYGMPAEQRMANALLTSAAPELYEACKLAYTFFADIKNEWPGRNSTLGQRILCDLRDALAKATGCDAEEIQNALSKARGES